MSKGRFAAAVLAIALVCVLLFTTLCAAAPARQSGGKGPGGGYGLGLKLSDPDRAHELPHLDYADSGMPMAASMDLSATLPPIGNQGQHPSCVGWSTGYYMKSWWEKREHPSWDMSNSQYYFSPSFVWNSINNHQDAGTSITSAFDLLQNSGDCDYAAFPYGDGSNYAQSPDDEQVQAAAQYKVQDWGYFFLEGGWGPYTRADVVPGLKLFLNAGKPVVFGMPVYQDFYNCGSYYEYDGHAALDGGHAVFIAGYNDNAGGSGRGGFLMVNSWGPTWNGDGKVWLSYDFVRRYVAEAYGVNSDLDSSPILQSVSPNYGSPGETITLSGYNFGAYRRGARVGFAGGPSGAIDGWANDEVRVKVPEGAVTGNVYVYDWNGEKSNGTTITVGASRLAASGWMLAEGATHPGFDEWVLVMNPNQQTAAVKLTYFTPAGKVAGPVFNLPAMSRTTVHVNENVPDSDVSTVVSSTNGVPVCAERAMYVATGDGKWGSHDTVAAPHPESDWYLAEGATRDGFDEWVLVMNPYLDPVSVKVTFQTPAGERQGPTVTLGAGTRYSVHVNDYLPGTDVSTRVQCLTSGRGVVAERSMYVSTPDGKRGCHNSMGVAAAETGWGLPEGATWQGFDEWVLVQNPTTTPAVAEFYFLAPDGVYRGPVLPVDPGGRISLRVNDFVPESDVSTMVFTQDASQKVVVERSMYMDTGDGKRGSHNAGASAYMSKLWYLPEGCTAPGFDEWVLVMNPDAEQDANVHLTFITPGGSVPGPSVTVGPGCRATFHVNQYVTGDVSTRVEGDQYVVCERAMYMSTADGKRDAHDSLGVMGAMLTGSAGAGGTGAGASASAIRRLARPLP